MRWTNSSRGWIYRQKGVGSFAPVRRIEQDLTALVSTSEEMGRRGWPLVTRVLSVDQAPAAAIWRERWRLPPESPIYAVCRLHVVDDAPLSVQTNFLPAALCPKLEEADLTSSLYRLLESRYGLRLWTGREILRARGATLHEAQLLDLSEKGRP